jgi:sirohydrochlorin ferrochelatase
LTTAFLFLSHGTRDAQGTDEFLQFTQLAGDESRRSLGQVGAAGPDGADGAGHVRPFASRSDPLIIRHCFLELRDPDLPTAAAACAQQGAEQIILIPLLLFAAGHWKTDVPALIEQARRAGADVPWYVTEPMGHDDAFIGAAVDRIRATPGWQSARTTTAITAHTPRTAPCPGPRPASATSDVAPRPQHLQDEHGPPGLLFVGRGGRDRAARRDALSVAQAIARQAGAVAWEPAFLAGPAPSLADGVQRLLAHPSVQKRKAITVLPYLWFSGHLLRSLPAQVQACCPSDIAVHVADHLGLHADLVARVVSRAIQAWESTRR